TVVVPADHIGVGLRQQKRTEAERRQGFHEEKAGWVLKRKIRGASSRAPRIRNGASDAATAQEERDTEDSECDGGRLGHLHDLEPGDATPFVVIAHLHGERLRGSAEARENGVVRRGG